MGDILGSKTQTSTNAYVSVLKVENPANIHNVLFHLIEKNVNAVLVKILASNDDITYETLLAETTIAKNASMYETCADPWRFFDVQVKSAVDDTHGSLKVVATGS